jgi:hypothetical protein
MEIRQVGRHVRALLGTLEEQVGRVWGEPRSRAPARFEVGGPLDAINDEFHDVYERSRTQARREVPVFVVLADELIVFHRGARTAHSFAPRAFHVIKSVTHAPLALYAALERLDGGAIDASTRARLAGLREQLSESLANLERDAGELLASTQRDLRAVLDACLGYVERLSDRATGSELDTFAGALGPILLRLADDATQLQLDALHRHVEQALGALTPDELAGLQVAVAGDHQARARSLAMQYFRLRLREPASSERRVTYAEGVSDEQAALALVGTRRIDHALGRAFFGDAHRLQRDILGDAAHERLRASRFAPIG